MQKKIKSALISVFYKDGLEQILRLLGEQEVRIYSTGGTQDYIERLGIKCTSAETVTGYPSILGGRVKTLHPKIFGGILGKRADESHRAEMLTHDIPEIDLVIVDLYPFEESVAATRDERQIIEKIDIGGPAMIRAAAKNFADVLVIASKKDYPALENILRAQGGETGIEERRTLAIKAFDVCTHYDNAISAYFNGLQVPTPFGAERSVLRYGENPHQSASFFGDMSEIFSQLHGKELSYNNLVDTDAAIALMADLANENEKIFAIIKHTNVCGAAAADTSAGAWKAALAGDPESAFGGVIISNSIVDEAAAEAVSEIFFEVLIAPGFEENALRILQRKKNRVLLALKKYPANPAQVKSLLNGVLVQDSDTANFTAWQEAGGRDTSAAQQESLKFANIICKHLKSNAIALAKGKQLIGKGCGQTSRVDALRNAIDKARQFAADINGAVLASDAFFPFDDCVRIAHAAGIEAFIQPGGSIRDNDSIEYCKVNGLPMVVTGTRHFRH